MKWALRFLAWATPLTALATVYYQPYCGFLTRAATWVFSVFGIEMHIERLEIMAPVDLALFGALALSSTSTPWQSRSVRLLVGWAVLVVLEIALVVVGTYLFLMLALPQASADHHLFRSVVSLLGWVGAPVVWIVLFRPRELLRHAMGFASAPPIPSRGATVWPERRSSTRLGKG